MQIHQLQPKHISKYRKIVGRGGKKGTYSGRGGKGQTARSGRKLAPVIRELIKRYPKLKGYRAERPRKNLAVVNIGWLEKKLKEGETVNSKSLAEKGVTAKNIKVLGKGKLTKKLVFEGVTMSQSAKVAIEKAGGVVKS